jgi:hypothetical protein
MQVFVCFLADRFLMWSLLRILQQIVLLLILIFKGLKRTTRYDKNKEKNGTVKVFVHGGQ